MLQVGALLLASTPETKSLSPFISTIVVSPIARIIAAELASLAADGQLWFDLLGENPGPIRGMCAERIPNAADPPLSDDATFLRLFFGRHRRRQVAGPRPGELPDWRTFFKDVRVSTGSIGWHRFDAERRRARKRFYQLERRMRRHVAIRRSWSNDPVMYRAGYGFAVLFAMETGGKWPHDDDDLYVPSLLPEACELLNNNLS